MFEDMLYFLIAFGFMAHYIFIVPYLQTLGMNYS